MTEEKLIFKGTTLSDRTRVEGTGINDMNDGLHLLDNNNDLGLIERSSMRILGIGRYPVFKNPTTTQKDLRDLQEKIMETVISFCEERNLTDIDRVDFHSDGLQSSIDFGTWVPSTDSSISAYGYEDDKLKKIGEWM